jgi:hypothetical protein
MTSLSEEADKPRKVRIDTFRQCLENHPPIGSKIKFKGEKQRYTVRASNTAYAICTKPFNARKTVLYTIVDLLRGVRGPENLIFGFGAETDEQCQEMLERVTSGETEVSYRHDLPLDIEYIEVTV